MRKLSTLEAFELVERGERIHCISGPLKGQSIQKRMLKAANSEEEIAAIRIENMLVTIEHFLQCRWEHIETCKACNGTGWIRCQCHEVKEAQ